MNTGELSFLGSQKKKYHKKINLDYHYFKSIKVIQMADARNSSDSSSGHEDEIPTQYLRESHSQIGLSNNINQSSCLDSAFEFTYILPRVFCQPAVIA